MPSSVIRHFTYHAATSTLRVIFVSGEVYEYENVPQEIYAGLKQSASKGTYLNRFIKPHYAYKKV
jgi:hypothetical protein